MANHDGSVTTKSRSASNNTDGKQGPVRVVYLAGDGRSGTTLLSRVLGSYAGCLAVGELYDIWLESLDGNRMCSCGVSLRDCEFWNAVMEEAFDGLDRGAIEHFIELRNSLQGVRHVPLMMFPWLRTRTFTDRLHEYVDVLERLYIAIQKVAGCDVIVDSSKLAAYAVALTESPYIDVSFVHTTRDSRACAFSWRRLKREPVAEGDGRYLRRRSLARSAVVWGLRNATIGWVSRRFVVSAKLKYEDFVGQPRAAATTLVQRLGIDEHSGNWTADDELWALRPSHIFAGNPNRVEQGRLRIRMDDEWRTRMSRAHKALVTGLTLPVLWKLGYLGRRRIEPATTAPDLVAREPQR